MKKTLSCIIATVAAMSAFASSTSQTQIISITDLPYTEGKLLLSISHGNERVIATIVEVESDTVNIPVDLSKYQGKELNIQAFQDLNGNNTLDFDTYGRPKEPCLRTTVTPESKTTVLQFNLIQY